MLICTLLLGLIFKFPSTILTEMLKTKRRFFLMLSIFGDKGLRPKKACASLVRSQNKSHMAQFKVGTA